MALRPLLLFPLLFSLPLAAQTIEREDMEKPSGFWAAEKPLQLGALLLGEAVGLGVGAWLGAAIGPTFSHDCERDDDACNDAWISPRGGAAIVGGLIGAGIGQAVGIGVSGHLMGKKPGFGAALVTTLGCDAVSFALAAALAGALPDGPAGTWIPVGTFIAGASLLPPLTYSWLDYHMRIATSPALNVQKGPGGRLHAGLRMDLVRITL